MRRRKTVFLLLFSLFKEEVGSFFSSFFSRFRRRKRREEKGEKGKEKEEEEKRETISDFALKQNKSNLPRYSSFRKIDFWEDFWENFREKEAKNKEKTYF